MTLYTCITPSRIMHILYSYIMKKHVEYAFLCEGTFNTLETLLMGLTFSLLHHVHVNVQMI